MPRYLIPTESRVDLAREFVNSVATDQDVYAWVGWSKPRTNTAPAITSTERELVVDVYRNMQFGKKIASTDVKLMVRNVPWEEGTVYSEYDDTDDLSDEDYFVVVEEGTYYHYWKCISNNRGAESTISPVFADLNPEDVSYQTADGYVWKYMCSVSDTVYNRHSTSLYAPIEANTTVEAAAVDGIDHVAVDETGEGYDNHLTGTFAAADIRVGGNTITFGIGSNSVASFVNGYYINCVLYIATGTGAGQYKRVLSSHANSTGRYVVVNSAFTTSPVATSTFEINPRVLVTGTGNDEDCEARAVINTVGNAVHSVEILSKGSGFSDATAVVEYHSSVDVVTEAEVRPIISPYGGHGYDAAEELGAVWVSVACTLSNTESNTIPIDNGFQQLGLLKGPVFDGVTVNFSNVVGTFTSSESAVAFSGRLLTEGALVADNAWLTVASGELSSRISVGDVLYFRSESANAQMLANVSSITNSTVAVLSSNSLFTGNATIWLANDYCRALVSNLVDANTVILDNVSRYCVATDATVVGVSSGARGTVTTVQRQGITKSFNTFVNLTKVSANVVSDTLDEDEQVYVGSNLASSIANGYVHSSTGSPTANVYLTDVWGSLDAGATLRGANSAAVVTVNESWLPELRQGSGEILHVENVTKVNRGGSQTEDINVILKF